MALRSETAGISAIRRVELIERRVRRKEADRVPQRRQSLAHEESIAPELARVEVQGDPWENIHQRSASAPRVSSTSQGSMTLPTDLLIFLPVSSTM